MFAQLLGPDLLPTTIFREVQSAQLNIYRRSDCVEFTGRRRGHSENHRVRISWPKKTGGEGGCVLRSIMQYHSLSSIKSFEILVGELFVPPDYLPLFVARLGGLVSLRLVATETFYGHFFTRLHNICAHGTIKGPLRGLKTIEVITSSLYPLPQLFDPIIPQVPTLRRLYFIWHPAMGDTLCDWEPIRHWAWQRTQEMNSKFERRYKVKTQIGRLRQSYT